MADLFGAAACSSPQRVAVCGNDETTAGYGGLGFGGAARGACQVIRWVM